jgi:signal transduction histidine kinase
VSVRTELRADVPAMPLDGNQMKQAFYNLIRNACQAMPEGGTLTVETTFNDYEIRIAFTDTGKGISADNLNHLFQPFFTTRGSGTGLGLMIVRRIVREHGGEIDIESRVGKGTRFTLFLPLVEKKIRLLEAG